MDVQRRGISQKLLWNICFCAILLLALGLRLKGIHNPIIDHPGWRQGDEAAIARNFATLKYNPLYPQTDYNGPPPNYVELELQIVPFLAATLYKVFGIHEIFGRLITLGFSLGTVAVIAFFGRWLFSSPVAGLFAALLFSTMPGSIYYGRTFTPDTTMVFFLTAALFAGSRYLVEDEALTWSGATKSGGLLLLALLAKPVAIVALVPLIAMIIARIRAGRTMRYAPVLAMLVLPLILFWMYDHFESSIAEWHWASGITTLHVMPSLRAALTNPPAFVQKWHYFTDVLRMLKQTMLGPFAIAFIWFAVFFPSQTRSRELLWGWAAGGFLYVYVVVTVERVDYYMYLLLPLFALAIGAAAADCLNWLQRPSVPRYLRFGLAAFILLGFFLDFAGSLRAIKPYYRYSKPVYQRAVALDRTLAPGALVVMGHYDPSVLYYINRKGWEEDPYIWTPFDEQSAIRKGSRYFIAIERNRFEKNVELYNWLQRFPVLEPQAKWPVYQTDPAKILPGAEARWQKFRAAEKAHTLSP